MYFNTKFIIAKWNNIRKNVKFSNHFNTKFVIAKYFFAECIVERLILFQYKICYSKIVITGKLDVAPFNFNTKFVIAKLMENGEIKHFIEFQYKICYSKIFSLLENITNLC